MKNLSTAALLVLVSTLSIGDLTASQFTKADFDVVEQDGTYSIKFHGEVVASGLQKFVPPVPEFKPEDFRVVVDAQGKPTLFVKSDKLKKPDPKEEFVVPGGFVPKVPFVCIEQNKWAEVRGLPNRTPLDNYVHIVVKDDIPNGSYFLQARKGITADLKRTQNTVADDVANPLGITDIGVIIKSKPSEVFRKIADFRGHPAFYLKQEERKVPGEMESQLSQLVDEIEKNSGEQHPCDFLTESMKGEIAQRYPYLMPYMCDECLDMKDNALKDFLANNQKGVQAETNLRLGYLGKDLKSIETAREIQRINNLQSLNQEKQTIDALLSQLQQSEASLKQQTQSDLPNEKQNAERQLLQLEQTRKKSETRLAQVIKEIGQSNLDVEVAKKEKIEAQLTQDIEKEVREGIEATAQLQPQQKMTRRQARRQIVIANPQEFQTQDHEIKEQVKERIDAIKALSDEKLDYFLVSFDFVSNGCFWKEGGTPRVSLLSQYLEESLKVGNVYIRPAKQEVSLDITDVFLTNALGVSYVSKLSQINSTLKLLCNAAANEDLSSIVSQLNKEADEVRKDVVATVKFAAENFNPRSAIRFSETGLVASAAQSFGGNITGTDLNDFTPERFTTLVGSNDVLSNIAGKEELIVKTFNAGTAQERIELALAALKIGQKVASVVLKYALK